MSWCDGWSRTPRSTADRMARLRARPPTVGARARCCRQPDARKPAACAPHVVSGARVVPGRCCAMHVPRGVGMAAAALVILASIVYGAVEGGHVPDDRERAQGCARPGRQRGRLPHHFDGARGQRPCQPRGVLAIAGVTGRTSLLFLDVGAARERLKTNPWIADATVLKLYPGELQIGITEREAFALWQKDGRVSVIADDGTVLEPFVAPRLLQLPLVVGRGAETRAKEFLALLDRYPAIRDQVRAVDPGRRAALEPAAEATASTFACRKPSRRPRSNGWSRSTATSKLITRDIAAIDLRLPDRVTVRLSPTAAAGAPRRAQGPKPRPRKGGAGMSIASQFGLTPKIKPLSPKRSAHRRRARCRHQQDRLPDRAAQAAGRRRMCCAGAATPIEVIGFGHTLARGMKAGAVIDLAEAEQAVRQARRSRRARRHSCSSNRSWFRSRPAARSELMRRERQCRRHDRHRRRHRARALRRQPAFGAPGPGRAAFAADRLFARRRRAASAIRAACWRAASASTCMS